MDLLNYSEFYITNVCNLNCINCNRFNNFAFSGHQYWKDHADQYKQWSNIVDIREIGIIGGEPLLNPDFPNWLHGIAKLWPNSKIKILTNGTQFKKWPELYSWLNQYSGRVEIHVSRHSYTHKQETLADIEGFIQAPFVKTSIVNINLWKESYNRIKDTAWPECNHPNAFENLPRHIQEECHTVHGVSPEIFNDTVFDIEYLDRNNIKIVFKLFNWFNNSTVCHDQTTNQLWLNRSNPVKAFDVCYSKNCHHFIRGKLYKCGPVGLLPEFIKQFPVNITSEENKLINDYEPAEFNWPKEKFQLFLSNLKDEIPIAQCTFCPETLSPIRFEASTKKHKIIKIKQL